MRIILLSTCLLCASTYALAATPMSAFLKNTKPAESITETVETVETAKSAHKKHMMTNPKEHKKKRGMIVQAIKDLKSNLQITNNALVALQERVGQLEITITDLPDAIVAAAIEAEDDRL